MADIIQTNVECLGIAYVSNRVDPVEHAAEHPYITDFRKYEFTDIEEVAERLAHVGSEFDLSPEEVLKALRISHSMNNGDPYEQA